MRVIGKPFRVADGNFRSDAAGGLLTMAVEIVEISNADILVPDRMRLSAHVLISANAIPALAAFITRGARPGGVRQEKGDQKLPPRFADLDLDFDMGIVAALGRSADRSMVKVARER